MRAISQIFIHFAIFLLIASAKPGLCYDLSLSYLDDTTGDHCEGPANNEFIANGIRMINYWDLCGAHLRTHYYEMKVDGGYGSTTEQINIGLKFTTSGTHMLDQTSTSSTYPPYIKIERTSSTGINLQVFFANHNGNDATPYLKFYEMYANGGGEYYVAEQWVTDHTLSLYTNTTYLLTISSSLGGRQYDPDAIVEALFELPTAALSSPTLASIGNKSVAEGSALSFSLSGSDADGDALSYSVSGNPSGSSLSGSTFSWTPGGSDSGTYTVTFSVSDGNGGSASEAITITVTEAGSDGACSSPVPSPSITATPTSGEVPLTVSFVDQTSGSVTQRVWDWGDGSDEYNSGSDKSLTHTYQSVGTYVVTFKANSCGGQAVLVYAESIRVTGKGFTDIRPPASSVNFGTVEVGTSQAAILEVTNAGTKAAQVRYTTLNGLRKQQFSVSEDKLTVAANSTASLEIVFSPVVAGLFEVVLQLDFGGADFFETILSGEAIQPNTAPTTARITATTAEDTPVTAKLVATDAGGSGLSYSITTGPAHGSATLVGAAVDYTPAADFSGLDSLSYVASDGELISLPAVLLIEVTAVNDAPSATGLSLETMEDQAVSATLTGTDPDGDDLTYHVSTDPAQGVVAIGGNEATYTPDPDVTGSDFFEFTVFDGVDYSPAARVDVAITAVNDLPRMRGPTDTLLVSGHRHVLPIEVFDVEGGAVAVELTAGPAGLVFEDGALIWRPDRDDAGRHLIELEGRDEAGGVTRLSVALEIEAAGYLPGDFNQDGRVDFGDFFLFVEAFGGQQAVFDLDGDKRVDFSDFFLFASYFGTEERAKLVRMAEAYLGLASSTGLGHAYPNPFNSEVRVPFSLQHEGRVVVRIYDLVGQVVCQLTDRYASAGYSELRWSGHDAQGDEVGAGLYLVVMTVGDQSWTRKVLYTK